jgi:hypothetical protein
MLTLRSFWTISIQTTSSFQQLTAASKPRSILYTTPSIRGPTADTAHTTAPKPKPKPHAFFPAIPEAFSLYITSWLSPFIAGTADTTGTVKPTDTAGNKPHGDFHHLSRLDSIGSRCHRRSP